MGEYIRKHLDSIYEMCPYSVPHVEIIKGTFGNDANLIGALQYYFACPFSVTEGQSSNAVKFRERNAENIKSL